MNCVVYGVSWDSRTCVKAQKNVINNRTTLHPYQYFAKHCFFLSQNSASTPHSHENPKMISGDTNTLLGSVQARVQWCSRSHHEGNSAQ